MIHPTAIIAPGAELDSSVEVGPYSIIGESVKIGANSKIGPHVVINGHTTIGQGNQFYQFSSIGEVNQDKKYAGEPTTTIIGDGNTFREYCTVHRGTSQDRGETRIGDDGWFMAYTHIAHDCQLGNHIILSNCATLAGHVDVGDWAILSGFAKIHQFCKIGAHAFVGMNASVSQDVPPFVLMSEEGPKGINLEGIKRRGFGDEDRRELRRAYRTLYRSGLKLAEAVEELSRSDNEAVVQLLAFLKKVERGIAR